MRRVFREILRRAPGPAVLLLGALLLAPFWAFPFFPSQDGPSHVENSWILLSLLTRRHPDLTAAYQLNLEPFPNWFSHASLTGLLTILGPAAAERVFLTACVLLLVGSFRHALAALRPGSANLWGLIVPFVNDSSLHLGYYNRAFAQVPFLLAVGFWIRRGGRLGVRGTACLAALLLWLYFCAAVGLVLAVLGLALLLTAVTVEEHLRAVPDRGRALRHRSVALATAALPALVLLARFSAREGSGVVGPGTGWRERLRALATLETLVSLDPREGWLSSALAAVLAVALATMIVSRVRKGDWGFQDGLLAVAAACTVGYFVAPAVAVAGHGPWGGSTHDRIGPYIWLVLLLWLGAQPLGKVPHRVLLASTIAIGVGLAGLRLPRYAELNEHLREYLSVAPWIPPGTTLLPLSFAHQGRSDDAQPLSHATWPFRHAASWLVVSREVVDADNYEAEVGFFPVAYRGGYDPYRLLGSSLDRMPSCVRIGRFNRLAPRPAEVILVWGARWADPGDPCADAVFQELETQYRRVFVSSPRGQAELYRRLVP